MLTLFIAEGQVNFIPLNNRIRTVPHVVRRCFSWSIISLHVKLVIMSRLTTIILAMNAKLNSPPMAWVIPKLYIEETL